MRIMSSVSARARFTRSRLLSFTIAVLGLTMTAPPAAAGVIRHDALDSQYLALGGNAAYASVGYVRGNTNSYGFSASGTLIGGNWVLTAGHVVDQAVDLSIRLGGQTYTAAEWFSHPKWNGDLGRGYDIGLMRFDTDLSAATGITAAQFYTGKDELGQIGTFAGYGRTGTGLTGDTTFDGQKRAGNNVIDAFLNTGGRADKSRVLLADFDNPLNAGDNSWGSGLPLDLEYLIAPGDSGGGLFLGGLLAGVHSFGWGRLDGDPNSDYGDASGHTRVSMFVDWILEAMGLSSGGGGKGGGGGRGGGRPFDLAMVGMTDIPEPGSLGVVAAGLAGIGFLRRKRKLTTPSAA